MHELSRRDFVQSAAVLAAAGSFGTGLMEARGQSDAARQPLPDGRGSGGSRGIVVVSSANGLRSTEKAAAMIRDGADTLDAVIAGVNIVEEDPEDMSVGYGGLPNEDGIVELDASVIHGPTYRAGSVASLRNIKTPSKVAKLVMERSDHVLIVGEGALRFAKAHGFKEEDLLTDKARKIWLDWKERHSKDDDWLAPEDAETILVPTSTAQPQGNPAGQPQGAGQPKGNPAGQPQGGAGKPQAAPGNKPGGANAQGDPANKPQSNATDGGQDGNGAWPHGNATDGPIDRRRIWPVTYGTITCLGLNAAGDISGVTTTSGLSFKIPGRVGDSPIIGAGLFVDNAVGAAGSTGRGEAVLKICGTHTIVEAMRHGMSPTEACLFALRRIVETTKERRLLDPEGRPNFDVKFYALSKDGRFGAASIWSGAQYAVYAEGQNRLEKAPHLYQRPDQK